MAFGNDLKKVLNGGESGENSYPAIGKDTTEKLHTELGKKGGFNAPVAHEMNREQHIQNQHILKNSEAQAEGAVNNKVVKPRPV